MGYPMAMNLVKGLGPKKSFLICDVNEDSLERFQTESKGRASVTIVANGFEAARAAVGAWRRALGQKPALTLLEYNHYHAAEPGRSQICLS